MKVQNTFFAITDYFVDSRFHLFMRRLESSELFCRFRRINPWPFLALLFFFAVILSAQRLYIDNQISEGSTFRQKPTSANIFIEDLLVSHKIRPLLIKINKNAK